MINKLEKKWNFLSDKVEALYRSGLKGTPFNIIIATFLIVILLQEETAPSTRIWIWWAVMMTVSLFRWGLIYWGVQNKTWINNEKWAFIGFAIPTFIIGLTWGLGYIAFLPFLTTIHKTFYIILVFGGMASGALSSLAASYICYYLYVFPMVFCLIFYHTLASGIPGLVISGIFIGYTLFLILIHRESHDLLMKNISLTHKQEELLGKIQTTNKKLQTANEHLKSISFIDGLTKVANRHYFKEIIQRDWEETRKSGDSIALLIIDIDYFKEFNDCYGHLKGDECLKTVANTLKKNIKRKTDLVARYGGDEFIVILNHTSIGAALSIARNIVADVEEEKIKHAKSKISNYVTISVGVASLTPTKKENFEGLIAQADKALYKAKQLGRNTVSATQLHPETYH